MTDHAGSDEEVHASVPASPDIETPPHQNITLIEHIYSLSEGSLGTLSKPWAFLKVNSRAKHANSMPLYVEGDTISGSVIIDLPNKKKMKAVILSLEGVILRAWEEPSVFYKESRTIWSPDSAEDSKLASVSPGSTLVGSYSWPFSFILPREVQAKSMTRNSTDTIKAPPTYTAHSSPAYIDYNVVVTFRRRALRGDQTLTARLNYIVFNKVPSPSALRFAAYVPDGQMSGPDTDPSGWRVLEPIKLKAQALESRTVEIDCSFAVGFPLVYAPGSPVPIWLILSGMNERAIKLLLGYKSLAVKLRRSLAIGPDADDDNRVEDRETTKDVVCAEGKIWPVDTRNDQIDGGQEISKVKFTLEGEVFIPTKTNGSFIFPGLCVRYYVDFCLSDENPPGLDFGKLPNNCLASQRIDVAIDPSAHIITKSREPPSHAMDQLTLYGNAHGALTLANHRFLRAIWARTTNRLVSSLYSTALS